MSLKQTILEQQIESMKAGEKERVSTLRTLAAAIKQVEIDTRTELNDTEVEQIVARQVKQLRDANKDFESAGRTDLVETNNAEITIMEEFLPEQLSEEELTTIVTEVLDTLSAGEADPQFGQIMGAVMKEVAGRADGNRVRAIIEKSLT